MASKDNDPATHPAIRKPAAPGRWDATEILAYKEEGSAPFRSVTRQVLFCDPAMTAEWRYFEVAPDGHTTLERHEHVHAVMVHRGCGRCLIGTEIRDLGAGDLVFIPAMTWHQFRAGAAGPLGFLCLVNVQRDRPQLPGPEAIAELSRSESVAKFIRT